MPGAGQSNRTYDAGDDVIREIVPLLVMLLFITTLLAGLGVGWLAIRGRQRLRELAYQERIAMIEKGLVPSPESDPSGFEAMFARRPPSIKAVRFRTAGVILTGFGLAMIILLSFVVPQVRGIALGVGGAITVLGLTVLGNGLLLAADEESNARRTGMRG
jgi:hypothetical protein